MDDVPPPLERLDDQGNVIHIVCQKHPRILPQFCIDAEYRKKYRPLFEKLSKLDDQIDSLATIMKENIESLKESLADLKESIEKNTLQ